VDPRQSDRDREQSATTSEKGSTPTQEEVKPAPEKEGKLSAFWKVCGGTLLSICAMLSVTAYQNLTNHIGGVSKDLVNLNTDMRKELSRLSENHGELVQKGDFNTRMTSVWENITGLRGQGTEIIALKERCELLLRQLERGEKERQELTRELRQLRRDQAGVDQQQELIREIRQLRERLAVVEKRNQGTEATPAVRRKEKDM
jgi:hypothetical protein